MEGKSCKLLLKLHLLCENENFLNITEVHKKKFYFMGAYTIHKNIYKFLEIQTN